ncbi:MAG: hypothetical protein U0R44_03735 [Candidatus Micrarchaeia archaeon]
MRLIAVLLSVALLAGCISFDRGTANLSNNTTQPNVTNISNATNITNVTEPPPPPPKPKEWERYNATGFSFEYPINMEIQQSAGGPSGIFSGSHEIQDGQTGEILVVTYINTVSAYGKNKDGLFRDNPTKAASDFLLQDKKEDTAGLLSKAYQTGDISTFGVVRDGAAAEIPFRIRFGNSTKVFSGYAIDLYVPERSLLVKMRVVALDSDLAKRIRDDFLVSFRIE